METFHTETESYHISARLSAMDSKKLSISLDARLLKQIDSARKRTGETRSGLIARLLRVWLEAVTCREPDTPRRRKDD